jgi:hypothetical protein
MTFLDVLLPVKGMELTEEQVSAATIAHAGASIAPAAGSIPAHKLCT